MSAWAWATTGRLRRPARAIRRAVENQVRGLGFSLIEVLSPCPTIWKMAPVEAQHWVRDVMEKTYPLGVFRDRTKEAQPRPHRPSSAPADLEEIPRMLGVARRAQLPASQRSMPRQPRPQRRRSRGAHCRLWRAGRAAARRGAGRSRTRRRPRSFVAAVVRA